jgi:hypothetical protein
MSSEVHPDFAHVGELSVNAAMSSPVEWRHARNNVILAGDPLSGASTSKLS